MGCCGSNRKQSHSAPAPASSSAPPQPARQGASVAVFRYDGSTSLTIIGPTTGRKYWFDRPGAEVAVDLRDRSSVARVPRLREVRIA
jgi:hypothetical protein